MAPMTPWQDKALWKWSQFGVGTVFAMILLSAMLWQVYHGQVLQERMADSISRIEGAAATQAASTMKQVSDNAVTMEFLRKASDADTIKLKMLEKLVEGNNTNIKALDMLLRKNEMNPDGGSE